MHGAALIWSKMQRKCVAVVQSILFFGWVCPYNFSSQNLQYKSGSSASEVLLPDACSKTLA